MKANSISKAIQNAISTVPDSNTRGKLHVSARSLLIDNIAAEKMTLSRADEQIHNAAVGPSNGIFYAVETFPCSTSFAKNYFRQNFGGFGGFVENSANSSIVTMARLSGNLEYFVDIVLCSPSDNEFVAVLGLMQNAEGDAAVVPDGIF